MMRIIRNVCLLLLLSVVGGIGLMQAYRIGQRRFLFEVEHMATPAFVPVIYDYYSGSAEWVDADRVRVDWSAVSPPLGENGAGFRCVGTIQVDRTTCYLLESSDRLYVERGEFVEPLLVAMAYFAEHDTLPSEVARLLRDPQLDRNRMAEILAQLNH